MTNSTHNSIGTGIFCACGTEIREGAGVCVSCLERDLSAEGTISAYIASAQLGDRPTDWAEIHDVLTGLDGLTTEQADGAIRSYRENMGL